MRSRNKIDFLVIGIIKRNYPDREVFITATRKEVNELISKESEMIALNATSIHYSRHRTNGEKLRNLPEAIHSRAHLAMAECPTC